MAKKKTSGPIVVNDSTPEQTRLQGTAITGNDLTIESYFPTTIYHIDKSEFLDVVKEVANEFLDKRKAEATLNEVYPVYMTENINYDPRMLEFANYIAQTAWNILDSQGYDVSTTATYFSEFWCQEHHKHSLMEQHAHGYGAQIVGFYFLDSPAGCSNVVFHDPKPAKVQVNLREKNVSNATAGSNMINFEAKPGTLMLTNAWLPHSFSRHHSDEPMRFIHFNVMVKDIREFGSPTPPAVEVI